MRNRHLCCEREPHRMKTNQYLGDCEPFSVAFAANDTVDRTDQGPNLDRAGHNRVFRVGNSQSRTVAAARASRRPFPHRTLIVCLTIWLIATQAMIMDKAKFETRVRLLEQSAQLFSPPQAALPKEPSSIPPSKAKVQRL